MVEPPEHPPTHARPVPSEPGRVVVAGGTGLIGRNLVPALHAAGHEVVVLTRRERGASEHARYQRWNPGQPGDWQQTLAGAHAVVNLCGASIGDGRWTPARKRELVESRTGPSRALVQACNALERPPAVLLQASGVNYYGTGEDERSEDDPPGSDFLAELSIDWEAPLANTPIRTVALRFGVVLDRQGGALTQMLLPFRLFAGGPVAGGRQWLSWIHIHDAVAAILFVMDSPLTDAVNVTAPRPVRNADFARSAGRALHRPALLPLPGFVLRAALGEQATLICDGVHAVPGRLEGAGFQFAFPDIGPALDDLTGP
ncbi:MAG: TIGR01777 family oxidoreductase [Pseudomonadales bacterium]